MVAMTSLGKHTSFVLRLDSGQLLGSAARLQGNLGVHDIILLAVDNAYLSGRLDQAQLTRTESLLNEMSRKTSVPAPRRTVSPQASAGRKRLAEEAPQGVPAPSNKQMAGRDRRISRASVDPPESSRRSGSAAAAPSFDYREFQHKAQDIVRKVLVGMKGMKVWFDHPVERNTVPDYYNVVKKPMDLGTIKNKLSRKQYANPGEFYVDIMLVWSNCALYNKPTAAVGQAGLNARKHFEELWERSKLGEGLRNPRRSTAGQAPSKWEGDEQPRDRAAPSSSARSARPPPQQQQQQQQPAKRSEPMPRPQQEMVANKLQTISETNSAAMEELQVVLASSAQGQAQDGSIEIDFDTMDNDTLWLLNDFVAKHLPDGKAPAPMADHSDGSDSDSDEELAGI